MSEWRRLVNIQNSHLVVAILDFGCHFEYIMNSILLYWYQ